ncbi:MAG TPA: hypothetical protein DDY49_10305 [Paenibacillaceae bacterium]|nr:hypothetical protein [Paenibacillaceae bacterium]
MGKIFTTVIILFAVMVVFLFVFFSLSSSLSTTNVFKKEIPYQESDIVTQNEISMAHHEINDLTGWGGIGNIK